MGKPTYILIVRHGESEGNRDKSVNSYTPNHLVPLTKKGHCQSLQAGEVLAGFLQNGVIKDCNNSKRSKRSIMFYTSPYLRTRQTCENIISRIKGIPNVDFNVREEPRMREQDFGNFQQSAQEMEKIWEERADYGHFFYRIPHGESAADVYDRVASFNESLYRQFKNDDFPNILVLVSHGIWSRVFLMKWFKWTYEEFETLKNIPHCQFLIMKRNRESLRYELKTKLQTWSVWCVKEGGKKKKNVDDESDGESDDESDAKKGNSQRFILCQLPEDNEVVQMIEAQKPAAESTREKDKKIAEMYRNIHSSEAKRLYENQLVTTLKMGNQSENNSSIESLNEPR